MEKVENLLRDFGLTEYEIRALITLLKLKVATADQISETGKIPLPRVYDTLGELKKKGFVLVSKTRPKKFRVVSIKRALKNLIIVKEDRFKRKIKNLENNIKIINNAILRIEPIKTAEKSWNIWSTEKRDNIQNVFNEMEKNAKKEILIFAGDMSWLPERVRNIKNAIKRGIKIRILMSRENESKDIIKHIKKIEKIGVKIKFGHKSPLRGEVIDNKNALIAFKSLNVKGKNKSKYELTIFENPTMIKVFKENFNFWWKQLK